jgi:hypothetical protein
MRGATRGSPGSVQTLSLEVVEGLGVLEEARPGKDS